MTSKDISWPCSLHLHVLLVFSSMLRYQRHHNQYELAPSRIHTDARGRCSLTVQQLLPLACCHQPIRAPQCQQSSNTPLTTSATTVWWTGWHGHPTAGTETPVSREMEATIRPSSTWASLHGCRPWLPLSRPQRRVTHTTLTPVARAATTPTMPRPHPWGRLLPGYPSQAVTRLRCQGYLPSMSVYPRLGLQPRVTYRMSTKISRGCGKVTGSTHSGRRTYRGYRQHRRGSGAIPPTTRKFSLRRRSSASSCPATQAPTTDRHLYHVECILLQHRRRARLLDRRRGT